MLSKKEQDLIEKVISGGGATGQSMTADPVGGTATLPASKKQGDGMQKVASVTPGQGEEETSVENNTKATGDMSAQNKASVAMKGGVKSEEADFSAELKALFGEEATPEFIEKAATLFEAAVALKTKEIEEYYMEAVTSAAADKIEEIREEYATKIDEYLSYVAEEWKSENEVAIETSLKNELTEEFIEGLKNLFAEHYIEIPSDKVDALEAMAAKVEELEERLNESVAAAIELKKEVAMHEMQDVFAEVSEGLALSQVEKFRTLAEAIDYTDTESYKKKLELVKENFLTEKKSSAPSNILTEEFESDEQPSAPVSRDMSKYVTAISRTLKK